MIDTNLSANLIRNILLNNSKEIECKYAEYDYDRKIKMAIDPRNLSPQYMIEPMIIDASHQVEIEMIYKKLISIFNKIFQGIEFEKNLLGSYGFGEVTISMIRDVERSKDMTLPLLRIDFFIDENNQIKICELNGDGLSGILSSDKINKAYHTLLDHFGLQHLYNTIQIRDMLVNTVLSSYRNSDMFCNESPTVAVVNYQRGNYVAESEYIADGFRKFGCKANVVDPKDLHYIDGELRYKDEKIDIVYNELLIFNFDSHQEELEALIMAIKDKRVYFYGAFRSRLIDDKRFFAFLYEPQIQRLLNNDERTFIYKYIPYSHILDATWTHKVQTEQKKYVIKSADSAGSVGVFVGSDYTPNEWENIASLSNQRSTVQEFIDTKKYKKLFVDLERGPSLREKDVRVVSGAFFFNGTFSGFYERAGTNLNINGSREDNYCAATLFERKW